MEKTYKILSHETPMPIAEIKQAYRGYWVFLVKAELDEFNGIISGIPVVIGSSQYDGAEDGIYEKYNRSEEYAPRIDMSLLPNRGFISALRPSGKSND